jgi:integrase/recombinase XerC
VAARSRSPLLSELIDDWQAELNQVQGAKARAHTDRAHRGHLRRVAAALVELLDVDVIEDDPMLGLRVADIDREATLITLVGRLRDHRPAYSPSTLACTVSTLRMLCGWLRRRGFIDGDPSLELNVRADPGLIGKVHFTPDEVDALTDAAWSSEPSRSIWPVRDVAIVQALARCGLRANELCMLRVGGVVRRDGELRIVEGAKRAKQRAVPVPGTVLELIDEWLIERRAVLGSAGRDARLFVRHDGAELNQQFLDRLIRRLARVCSIEMPDGASVHALRHSYGVTLATAGVPLPVIQGLFGHSDPRTTAVYTKMTNKEHAAALHAAGLM